MAESKIRIGTHNGGFHADDIFAVASLLLYLGKEKDEVDIIRTRDPELFSTADYLVDVGMVYDPAKNRLDHHQAGGAGKRNNGIPYAAFGLVWKEFGEQIAGNKKAAEKIDQKLVQPVDAQDSGFVAWEPVVKDFSPYTIQSALLSFSPGPDKSSKESDRIFLDLLDLARQIISNEVRKALWEVDAERVIMNAYHDSLDKRLIVLENSRGWGHFVRDVLERFPEPLYTIVERKNGDWLAIAVEKEMFVSRKPFPENWCGKVDEELQKTSGVPDAVFCHADGFMCIAKTKEGVRQLAKLALEK
jgi:uncharacterized UPF0160 family protein